MPFRRKRRRNRAEADAPEGAVVLGLEMARAIQEEERHRAAAGKAPSPLAGVEYDAQAGEFDLHRFVESPVDATLSDFAASYAGLEADVAADVRAALTQDDLYTLLAFVRRSVLASLQGRSTPSLDEALAALTAIDLDRVDWRDVAVAAELLGWALARVGVDHAAAFRRVIERCEPGVADVLAGVAARDAGKLEPGYWAPVQTAGGLVLAQTNYDEYEPTVDLVGIAIDVGEVLEGDVYRISDVTVATELPPVWLNAPDADALERALKGVAAGVSLTCEMRAGAAAAAREQHLFVFLAEAATPEDAQVIATAAVPTDSFDAIGVSAGSVCCVVVGRSVVVSVPSFEHDGSLRRFERALSRVLEQRV